MGRKLFTYAVAVLASVCLIGCVCGPPIERQVDTAFDAMTHLGIAVAAYHAGAGRWPNSPDELRKSPILLNLDRYRNLRFEPQPDGGLAISFDQWTAPGGT